MKISFCDLFDYEKINAGYVKSTLTDTQTVHYIVYKKDQQTS